MAKAISNEKGSQAWGICLTQQVPKFILSLFDYNMFKYHPSKDIGYQTWESSLRIKA